MSDRRLEFRRQRRRETKHRAKSEDSHTNRRKRTEKAFDQLEIKGLAKSVPFYSPETQSSTCRLKVYNSSRSKVGGDREIGVH